jgi:hypothetical protein
VTELHVSNRGQNMSLYLPLKSTNFRLNRGYFAMSETSSLPLRSHIVNIGQHFAKVEGGSGCMLKVNTIDQSR